MRTGRQQRKGREEKKRQEEEKKRQEEEKKRQEEEKKRQEEEKKGQEEEEEKKREEFLQKVNELDIGTDYEPLADFRLQNKRCMLTYRTHIPKDAYKAWLCKHSKRTPIIYMAHETGDKHHNYEHTHVLIDFGKIFQTTNARFFDYDGIHPHIKKVLNVNHWKNCLVYLSKEDPENGHLAKEAVENLYDSIISCETDTIAYSKFVKKPNDYFGVKAIRSAVNDNKNLVVINKEDYLPWQKVFVKVNTRQANETRTINWIYDERGGCGKTKWAHYMIDCFGDDWAYMNDIGSKRDFTHNLKNFKDAGWNGTGMIIDLPRSFDISSSDLYSSLESLIDGRIVSTKYTGGFVNIGSPHVWVFSNSLPKISRMSRDRWRVLNVAKKGKQVKLIRYDFSAKDYKYACINHGYIPFSWYCSEESSSSGTLDDISL